MSSKTDAVTKKKLNRWLAELRPLYYKGMLGLNQKASMDKLAGLGIGVKTFEEAFKRQVTALSSVDLTKASMLQRSLAARFKSGYKQFYTAYDEILRNYSAKPLREVQNLFLKSAKSSTLRFTETPRPGVKPREWQPKNYASMMARTRSSEVSTFLTTTEMKRVGQDIVYITDANTVTPICTLYEDKYFSLSGSGRLPKIEFSPPFHPNCRHLMVPVREEDEAKYVAHNRKKDKEIAIKKATWTDAEKRAVLRQQDYLRSNRSI